MNRRQRAQQIADAIKATYDPAGVIICWNESQARKYGTFSLPPDTVGFACVYEMQGEDVTPVVPIAERVLFADDDLTDSILATVGRFIMQHFELVMTAEQMRPHYAIIEAAYGNGKTTGKSTKSE